MPDASSIPAVDVDPLISGGPGRARAARAIDAACREVGFFYALGHGVDEGLQRQLEETSRRFFALPIDEKLAIRMERGGRAWRGYFPLGGELTLGRPDEKEGLYFGAEHSADDPRVLAGTPLCGPNLFPDVPGMHHGVLAYMAEMTRLGKALMEGIALGLGLAASYFEERYTRDPTILFRIFHYPPLGLDATGDTPWSVGEHTDYGLLTILRQDATAGLQVKARGGWRDAPPLEGSFVCNIGDMLDRMSGGLYRSTPHRVRNTSGRSRLSFAFFFDPSMEAQVHPIRAGRDDASQRWDGIGVHDFQGTYGEYLLRKVAKVFPGLGSEVL